MKIKATLVSIVILAIIAPIYIHAGHHNDQQQTEQVIIGDTAPIDNEMQPEEENKEATITFTRKTNKALEEEAALHKKENKQTIRGLFTLGGFDKDKKDKNKIQISGKN